MGETCSFFVSSDHFKDVIIESGHSVEILNSDFSRVDTGELLPAVEVNNISAEFVDSYYVIDRCFFDLHAR